MEAARPNVVSPKNVRACAHRRADVVLDLSLDVRGDIRGRAPSGCFLSLLLLLFSRKKIAPWVVAGPFCRGGVCALFPPVAAVGKKEGAQEKKKEGTTQEGDPKRQTKKKRATIPFFPPLGRGRGRWSASVPCWSLARLLLPLWVDRPQRPLGPSRPWDGDPMCKRAHDPQHRRHRHTRHESPRPAAWRCPTHKEKNEETKTKYKEKRKTKGPRCH